MAAVIPMVPMRFWQVLAICLVALVVLWWFVSGQRKASLKGRTRKRMGDLGPGNADDEREPLSRMSNAIAEAKRTIARSPDIDKGRAPLYRIPWVLFIGDTEQTSREGFAKNHLGDRTSIDILGEQNALVDALDALGKPLIVAAALGLETDHAPVTDRCIADAFHLGGFQGRVVDVQAGGAGQRGRAKGMMIAPAAGIAYWRLSSFYFLYYAFLGAMMPYWSLYLQSQGMGSAAIRLSPLGAAFGNPCPASAMRA